MNPSDIATYKTLIIHLARAKLSVMLNVIILFTKILQSQSAFYLPEWNGMLIISKVKSTHNGLSWCWWLVFSITT